MLKRYFALLVVLSLLSCKSKEDKMFFDFDTVEYYSLKKEKEKEMYENDQKGINDPVFANVLYNESPEDLNNEKFATTINSTGFSKYTLLKNDVEELRNDIFIEKMSFKAFYYRYACAPEYRDILVFKKQNKTTGIAKICLSCKQYYLVSSKKNIEIENFGTKDEFVYLEKLFRLYKDKKTRKTVL
ncbi:hypothetical protein [Flavobacterium sp. FlaQc-50]|jgi:hypothetical protein|uniref:hypothetical protein n=1 Tax=unclassified Flavobacterium TaxID=196869 RepID=UPI0037575FC8